MNTLHFEDWRQDEVAADIRYNNQLAREKEVFQMLQPRLEIDGKQWCCIWGEMPEKFIAGFGDTPAKAISDFYNSYLTAKP